MTNKTVLLLENTLERRQQLIFLLKLAGYRSRSVASAAEAINWLTTCVGTEDDILCLLVNTPGPAATAAQLVEQCRACGLSLPVLLVDRNAPPLAVQPAARQQLDRLGVHVCLPAELTATLHHLAGRVSAGPCRQVC